METIPYGGRERELNDEHSESNRAAVYYSCLVLLTDVERSIRHAGEKISLDAFGISWPQAKLIAYLAHGQTTTQVQIASDLHYDEGALSRLLSRLDPYGLVERFPSSKDRRSCCICLIQRGMRLAKELFATFEQLDGLPFTIFTEDEKPKLIELLKRLLRNGLDDAARRW
ncbi:MarR family winged helix-turn-helix transcriptional regulator [Paraburkholderia sp. MM5384-R2]|uniref:MarR family winged helix-turn-helix transcriptional regulator n=1 Tax=Paraburkholderia sp. MM5384-R2 TaxID=2723097 RepID=UPI00161A7908|nr:MarR family winged helix-turn-helix transcriptional regulator [Paraburkholderia sp. MM5384-R2]MBB5497615.1 DNA-binding MarR family transcriptional regulator [Paraburkholderia sp. MM5384-R2]